jgi:hypothetical protein
MKYGYSIAKMAILTIDQLLATRIVEAGMRDSYSSRAA